jgi:hypothetical protein
MLLDDLGCWVRDVFLEGGGRQLDVVALDEVVAADGEGEGDGGGSVVGVDWAFHLAVFLSFFLSLSLLFVSDGVWSLYGVDVVGYAVCHLSFAREKEGAESEIAARGHKQVLHVSRCITQHISSFHSATLPRTWEQQWDQTGAKPGSGKQGTASQRLYSV